MGVTLEVPGSTCGADVGAGLATVGGIVSVGAVVAVGGICVGVAIGGTALGDGGTLVAVGGTAVAPVLHAPSRATRVKKMAILKTDLDMGSLL